MIYSVFKGDMSRVCHDTEKMGYRNSCWAIRPMHFVGLDKMGVYVMDDTNDSMNVLKLEINGVVDHIRNNGFMHNFTCSTCGDKIGQVMACMDGNENGLIMFVYHPDDGFTYSDEYGRRDHCSQCIEDYSMKTCRLGVFDRRLVRDRAFQLGDDPYGNDHCDEDSDCDMLSE